MKQRYCELTHDLCLRAAFACYERKWHRPDFRALCGSMEVCLTRN